MEYFLVFLLGMALAVVIVFVARPGLFIRSGPDFSLMEVVFEEALQELKERQSQLIAEIEEKHASLLELQGEMVRTFLPPDIQSPKVLAVLELAQEGCDEVTIAKRLGLGTGEVQLILELNQSEAAEAKKEAKSCRDLAENG
ncbi:MAG: hypothetical protein GX335_06440 [Firmicutes bacterium]|nr:hypothetical protein [Bacillota bacterium]